MTSLLLKVKREKRKDDTDTSTRFDLKKVKKEKMEDHDSGHSSFDTSLPDDWDQKFIKIEQVSPTEPFDKVTTHDAVAFQVTPAIISDVNHTVMTSTVVKPRDVTPITKLVTTTSVFKPSPTSGKIVSQNWCRRLTFVEEKDSEIDSEERGESKDENSSHRPGLFSRESKFLIPILRQLNFGAIFQSLK